MYIFFQGLKTVMIQDSDLESRPVIRLDQHFQKIRVEPKK